MVKFVIVLFALVSAAVASPVIRPFDHARAIRSSIYPYSDYSDYSDYNDYNNYNNYYPYQRHPSPYVPRLPNFDRNYANANAQASSNGFGGSSSAQASAQAGTNGYYGGLF